MPCKDWKDEWVAHLYDELDSVEQGALDVHLERCAECRATIDQLSHTRRILLGSAPAVPVAPRVVVLKPRASWSTAWAFASGVAAAVLIFALGVFVARGPQAEPASSETLQASAEHVADLRNQLAAMQARLEQFESGPAPDANLTDDQLRVALDRLERRVNRSRAEELDYLMQSITASELRTGQWIGENRQALNMLALRQDPRFRER